MYSIIISTLYSITFVTKCIVTECIDTCAAAVTANQLWYITAHIVYWVDVCVHNFNTISFYETPQAYGRCKELLGLFSSLESVIRKICTIWYERIDCSLIVVYSGMSCWDRKHCCVSSCFKLMCSGTKGSHISHLVVSCSYTYLGLCRANSVVLVYFTTSWGNRDQRTCYNSHSDAFHALGYRITTSN